MSVSASCKNAIHHKVIMQQRIAFCKNLMHFAKSALYLAVVPAYSARNILELSWQCNINAFMQEQNQALMEARPSIRFHSIAILNKSDNSTICVSTSWGSDHHYVLRRAAIQGCRAAIHDAEQPSRMHGGHPGCMATIHDARAQITVYPRPRTRLGLPRFTRKASLAKMFARSELCDQHLQLLWFLGPNILIHRRGWIEGWHSSLSPPSAWQSPSCC